MFNKNSLFKYIVMTFVLSSSVAPSKAIVRLYDTDFESFNVGEINGQQSWVTLQAGNSAVGFAAITNSAPSATGQALQVQSGTTSAESPRQAISPSFGSLYNTAVAQGETTLFARLSMYLPSGQAAAARQGAVVFDSTGAKVLTGFYVAADTGNFYLIGNYNNNGNIANYPFTTGAQLGFDQWVDVTLTWDRITGRFITYWGTAQPGVDGFYVDGAAAGSIADTFSFYGDRRTASIASTAYFDNVTIDMQGAPGDADAVPGPLPVLGAAAAFAKARRLRQRIQDRHSLSIVQSR